MVKKSTVVVKNEPELSESEQEEIESPVEKPRKTREYIMTPARQEAIKKMIEARQKKAKEARVSKELNKIETVETKIKSKKEKLNAYKESDEYIKPTPKPKSHPVEIFSSSESESESEIENYKEYVKRMKAKAKQRQKEQHNHQYDYASRENQQYIFM